MGDGVSALPILAFAALVPTVSVGFGHHEERLELELAGQKSTETRIDERILVAFGVAHPLAARFDGHASLGFGPTFQQGRYQLVLREDVTFVHRWSWLAVRAGLGPGLSLDTTESTMSFAELGLPLTLTVAESVELVYRPFLSVPLAGDRRDVFAGSRTRSADLAFVPFDLTLRLRVRALGF